MPVTLTASQRNSMAAASQSAVALSAASNPIERSPRSSFKPADVAIHQVSLWAGWRGKALARAPLFSQRFGLATQAGHAMDRALKTLAPGMFDAVARKALDAARASSSSGPARDRLRGDVPAQSLAGALAQAVDRNPPLQQFLHKLGSAIPAGQSKDSPAYCALVYCGLKPALEALRATTADAPGRRVLDQMLHGLHDLRMAGDAGGRLSDLLDGIKMAGPDQAALAAHRQAQMDAHRQSAVQAVESGVRTLPADQPADAGKAVLLSPAWAPARKEIEAVMKLGAGDALEDLVNRMAVDAQRQRKGGADMAKFYADQLRAAMPELLQALGPTAGLLQKVQASVNDWTKGRLSPDTGASVLPNIVMVLGVAQAAKASAAFAQGAHKQALQVLAKVAQTVAQGDAGGLTRWLWPAQARAVSAAVGCAALVLRQAMLTLVATPSARSAEGEPAGQPMVARAIDTDRKHGSSRTERGSESDSPIDAENFRAFDGEPVPTLESSPVQGHSSDDDDDLPMPALIVVDAPNPPPIDDAPPRVTRAVSLAAPTNHHALMPPDSAPKATLNPVRFHVAAPGAHEVHGVFGPVKPPKKPATVAS